MTTIDALIEFWPMTLMIYGMLASGSWLILMMTPLFSEKMHCKTKQSVLFSVFISMTLIGWVVGIGYVLKEIAKAWIELPDENKDLKEK